MIIGLSGYAQSGKDTVAKYLVENHGFERVAFADPIRDLLYEMNPTVGFEVDGGGWDLQYVVDRDGWDEAKKDPEIRRLLQTLGVGARNIIDTDLWIIKALRTMSGDGNYVVTDVRFQNEATALRSPLRTGTAQIWRVERNGVGAVNSHISEHDLDNWEFDAYIHNNSTIEDLEFAVKTTLMARI
jgi:hypothetical protein